MSLKAKTKRVGADTSASEVKELVLPAQVGRHVQPSSRLSTGSSRDDVQPSSRLSTGSSRDDVQRSVEDGLVRSKADQAPAEEPEYGDLGRALAVDHPFSYSIIGGTNSGKTNLVNLLMYRATMEHQFDRIVVLCGAPDRQDDYSWCPSKWVFMEPTVAHIETILKQQRGEAKNTRTCLILDDVVGVLSMTAKTKGGASMAVFPVLGAAARKYNMSVVFIVQDGAFTTPHILSGMTAIFATRLGPNDEERLYDRQQQYKGPGSLAKFQQFLNNRKIGNGFYDIVRVDVAWRGDPQCVVFPCPKAPAFRIT